MEICIFKLMHTFYSFFHIFYQTQIQFLINVFEIKKRENMFLIMSLMNKHYEFLNISKYF